MRNFLRPSFFVLSVIFYVGSLQAHILPEALVQNVHSGETWLVLAFAEESEEGSQLSKKGRKIRREIEMALQDKGCDIYILPRKERKEIEQKRSKPFLAKFPPVLKQLANKKEIRLLTGSYSTDEVIEWSYLYYDPIKKRKFVYYNEESEKKEKDEGNLKSRRKWSEPNSQEIKKLPNKKEMYHVTGEAKKQWWSLFGDAHLGQRKAKREWQIDRISERVMKSPELKAFLNAANLKTDKEKLKEISGHVENAKNTWMSTDSFGAYLKAFAISLELNNKELQKLLFEELRSRREFINDRKSSID